MGEVVEGIIKKGEIVYGVTTGFGKFCNVIISSEDTRKLQINLIRSHSVGVGEYFPEEIVRAMMLLKKLNIPVVGLMEAAINFALMLGRKFSIITTTKRGIAATEDHLRMYDFYERCASIRAVN
ncbi:MAG TPA: aromatic amino acid lyase, partial [Thermoanaerobacterales bacterium]|nr:aromatic amino acid lyase [Thermoanaerobacterales bacterium]